MKVAQSAFVVLSRLTGDRRQKSSYGLADASDVNDWVLHQPKKEKIDCVLLCATFLSCFVLFTGYYESTWYSYDPGYDLLQDKTGVHVRAYGVLSGITCKTRWVL